MKENLWYLAIDLLEQLWTFSQSSDKLIASKGKRLCRRRCSWSFRAWRRTEKGDHSGNFHTLVTMLERFPSQRQWKLPCLPRSPPRGLLWDFRHHDTAAPGHAWEVSVLLTEGTRHPVAPSMALRSLVSSTLNSVVQIHISLAHVLWIYPGY